jgi:general secretion pathway protein A
VAGREEGIFTDTAYKLIYEASAGIPRKINNICDISLMLGYTKGLLKIDDTIVKTVAEDLREYKQTATATLKTGIGKG